MVPDGAPHAVASPVRSHVRRFPLTVTHGVWIVVLAAAALRLVPIWFGLPYPHARPDEAVAIGHAVAALEGDLNPRFFHWPSLTFYAFAAVFGLASSVRTLLGFDAVLSDIDRTLLARGTIAIAGALTTLVLFRIGRRAGDAITGLLAAALLAVAMLHVRESHFAMTDALMVLLLTGSLALLLRAMDDGHAPPRAAGFGWAGFVGGLAASTKYSAAAVVVAMGAAQLVILARSAGQRLALRSWLPSAAFGAAFAVGFLIATPYAVLDYSRFSADLLYDFTHLSTGHGINLGRGWLYHATRSLPYGLGLVTFLLAIPGVAVMARRAPAQTFVLASFAAAFYASIGSGYTVFFRYVLPLVPLGCLAAAFAVRGIADLVSARTSLRPATALLLAGGLAVAPSLLNSVWFDALLARKDTRVVAAEWLAPRIAPGETLHDSGGDYARLDLGRIRYHFWFYDAATGSFGHPQGHTPDWLVLHQSPLRTYGWHSAGLRRLAAEQYDLVWEVRATKGPASRAVYDLQDAFFMPLSSFHTVERPGPSIAIYRRRDLPAVAR